MKLVVVGGVAGGMSAAARARRLSEDAEIIVLERGGELELIEEHVGEGAYLSSADAKALAGLPSKNQLIAETIAQLLSPVHDVTNALSGNLHALLDGVEANAAA